MIEILFDHSYKDDYFMLSNISVTIIDQAEKENLEMKLIKVHLSKDGGHTPVIV